MHRGQRHLRIDQQVAAADINLIFQHDSDGFTGTGFLQVAVKRHNTRHAGFNARWQYLQALSDLHAAGSHGPGETAEVEVGPVNKLDRETQRLIFHHATDFNGFQHFQQRRAAVPRHADALGRDVVPFKGRKRNKANINVTRQLPGKGEVLFANAIKRLFAKIHQIHFIHRHHQVFNSQQRRDKAMTASLIEHAFARIHQQNRQIAGGSAGGHIAGVLLVPRGVGDNKFAFLGREIAIGDIDGDALLAFSLQAIHQQRQIQFFTLRAVTLTVIMQR